MTLDECDKHFEAIRKATSYAEAISRLNPLFSAYYILEFKLSRGPRFYRVRRQPEESWLSVCDIGPPNPAKATIQRLNNAGEPTFYAAFNLFTAAAETDALEGEEIWIGSFRIKPNHAIATVAIGEFHFCERSGHSRLPGLSSRPKGHLKDLGQDEGEVVGYIDAFFASILADPNAKDSNYILTRAIAKQIYNRVPQAQAIVYPSVKDYTAFNIAIKGEAYEEHLHPTSCSHLEIAKTREFGFASFKNKRNAHGVSADGKFQWTQAVSDRESIEFGLTAEERREQEAWNARGPRR